MFGQKKTTRPSSGKKNHDLGMFGLGMDFGMEDDDDEEDLEAELAALQGNQPRKKAPKVQKKMMKMADIDKLAAQCMEDDDDDDSDVGDDPDLLAELEGLNPMENNVSGSDITPSLVPSTTSLNTSNKTSNQTNMISERKAMYETAIANAEKAGEGSKARRYKRGLKEIEKMIKASQAGKSINIDELPPPVSTGETGPKVPSEHSSPNTTSSTSETQVPLIDLGTSEDLGNIGQAKQPTTKPTAPAKPTPEKPPSIPLKPEKPPSIPIKPQKPPSIPLKSKPASITNTEDMSLINELSRRRDEYKNAAVVAKKGGDLKTAREYLLTFKDYNVLIEAAKEGKTFDLTQCPQLSGSGTTASKPEPTVSEMNLQSSSASGSAKKSGPPPPPTSVLEALHQRLEKYESGVEDAKNEGNSGKARRMGRIVKQYQDAIRDHKAKKPVNYDELPVPPGYAPIPTETPVRSAASRQAPQPPGAKAAAPGPPNRTPSQNVAAKPVPKARNQKELRSLMERQKEFKVAALEAKKRGDLEAARNHLRSAKGFDSMIEAAENGLRVDLSNVPPSPNLGKNLDKPLTPRAEFVMVNEQDCTPDKSNREEVFAGLEKSLKQQYEMCNKNMQHYSQLGDIENSKKFEKLAVNCRKDYEAVQNAFKHGNPSPRYHYENRTFTIVRSNTDLGDQDCELTVVKCINVPLPSGYSKDDMKLYITYEFPFPNEQPQTGYTDAIKHSINPEFKQSFKLSIDRKNRALARIFRRQGVKFEVKHSRGFLKGDKTIAQAAVKLAIFDNRSQIHECVGLMDPDKGRKAVGGKIEVKLRIREPLADKDVEILTEKWLVIDAYVVPSNRPISASSTQQVNNKAGDAKTKNMSKVCAIE